MVLVSNFSCGAEVLRNPRYPHSQKIITIAKLCVSVLYNTSELSRDVGRTRRMRPPDTDELCQFFDNMQIINLLAMYINGRGSGFDSLRPGRACFRGGAGMPVFPGVILRIIIKKSKKGRKKVEKIFALRKKGLSLQSRFGRPRFCGAPLPGKFIEKTGQK